LNAKVFRVEARLAGIDSLAWKLAFYLANQENRYEVVREQDLHAD